MTACQHTGCPRTATHVPKIMVPASGWAIELHTPLSAIMGLKLCEQHAKEFPARDQFFNAETRDQWRDIFSVIVKAMGSQCPPDYERAFTRIVSLTSHEFKQYEAAAGGAR